MGRWAGDERKTKTKDKERLQQDHIKYCIQMGIPRPYPKLILDRKEYHALLVANGQPKRAAYGQCDRELQSIFVDCSTRFYQTTTYGKIRKNTKMERFYKQIA